MDPEKSELLSLPHELLISICELLEEKDLLNLSQVNCQIYNELDHLIYKLLDRGGYLAHSAKSPANFCLWMAAEHNLLRILEKAISEGADINISDKFLKFTPLIVAANEGHAEIVRLLLEQSGINVNASNKSGSTAFHSASQSGHADIVSILLDQPGIDVIASDDGNQTALHLASGCGHADIVRLLLEQSGINVNASNKSGSTALHLASQYGHADIVSILLHQSSIDINASNNDNQTALHLASRHARADVIKILTAPSNF